MTSQSLGYIFSHVFLPPHLPHADDYGNGSGDRALVELLLQSARRFRDINEPQWYQTWSTVCRIVRTFASLHQHDDTLSKDALRSAIREVKDGNIVLLHITMQNSGLIVRKGTVGYIFESFEASPLAANVLASSTALQWDFPSRAVIVPASTIEDEDFEASFTEFLEKASIEPIQQYAAKTRKANSDAYESRDTTAPAIVGQLLMAILEANGQSHTPTLTRKRIRDDVCWNDGAENPWRRSATWLVLRVGLQRCLCFLLGNGLGTLHYKFFMAYFMSSLLEGFSKEATSSPDQLAFARSKVARRVAKLQRQVMMPSQLTQASETMMCRYDKCFDRAVHNANDRLQKKWDNVRASSSKRVALLPNRAQPQSTVLSLAHSRMILQQILQYDGYVRHLTQFWPDKRFLRSPNQVSGSIKVQSRETHSVLDYLSLADVEETLKIQSATQGHAESQDMDQLSVDLTYNLAKYQEMALPAYDSAPEEISLMLLLIMELWQALDRIALKLYPLLAEYDPGFPSQLLDPLQISHIEDMRRLQKIQDYLDRRRLAADGSFPSNFDAMSRFSFPVRYFDQCLEMQDLLKSIESDNASMRTYKMAEWKSLSSKHSELLQEAAGTSCLFVEDKDDPSGASVHDEGRCRKHYLLRVARRMTIDVHEALIPSDSVQAKAVIFELRLPQGFAAWRDSTWQILHLARPPTRPHSSPVGKLQDFHALSPYRETTDNLLSLASDKKAFENTHYATVRFPIVFKKVCVPHGHVYGLYDAKRGLWTARHRHPVTFANLCAPSIPQNSTYFSMQNYVHPVFPAISTNETLANQTRCPNAITVSEFNAFQDLRHGAELQWLRLLRELGSSNLVFGTLEVRILVTQLALMAGPSKGRSILRTHHWVFEDRNFCMALLAQIRRRLGDIASNWRESQTAACMITLLQRVLFLATSDDAKQEAEDLLMEVRNTTYIWTRLLRDEICNAPDIETAHRRSMDAFMAAILTRKTFVVELLKQEALLQTDALTCFLECGFSLRENLNKGQADYISRMPPNQKQLVLADIRLLYQLESRIRYSMQKQPSAISQAVNNVWAFEGVDSARARIFTSWSPLGEPYRGWFTAKSSNIQGILQQEVHMDIFEGTLLIDGQPLGRLPEEYTKQAFFQRLFGPQVFMTFPSCLPGMSYMLARCYRGHEVHFGFRDGVVFIRARIRGRRLELVPETVFLGHLSKSPPDLPLPLINEHSHWLDLDAHTIEIRHVRSSWQKKLSDWVINLHTSQAHRRKSLLVDPRSALFRQVAQVIEPFESRNWMTVYQPEKANLSLHLPKLELSFRVHQCGLLESQQLRAIVDQDQDAGTLYGMRSSLVLLDWVIPEDRSILVAMGSARITPNVGSDHANVDISHTGFYARFYINKELGRLDCATETRLIYYKAYCHAVTASVMPDPLTRRTGTEEAIHCLQAGYSQPWAPIDHESQQILLRIAELTPCRSYYPEGLKVLQKVTWNATLASAAQHNDFLPLITELINQSTTLRQFYSSIEDAPLARHKNDLHLVSRAALRNRAYESQGQQVARPSPPDPVYVARDCVQSAHAENAFEATLHLRKRSCNIAVCQDLALEFESWPFIQGFCHNFKLPLLSEQVNVDFATNWGSLFTLCQKATLPQQQLKLMFLFATMAFNEVNMDVVRSLLALLITDESYSLQTPQASSFTDFRRDQVPTVNDLMDPIRPFRVPYPGDERTLQPGVKTNLRQRQRLELAQKTHEEQSEAEARILARHFLAQWPRRDLSLQGIAELPLITPEKGLLAVRPEWERLVDNYMLSRHLWQVQKILDKCKATKLPSALHVVSTNRAQFPSMIASKTDHSLLDLLSESSGSACNEDPSLESDLIHSNSKALQESPSRRDVLETTEVRALIQKPPSNRPSLQVRNEIKEVIPELGTLVAAFANSDDEVRQKYASDLACSLDALRSYHSDHNKKAFGSENRVIYQITPDRLSLAILSARKLVTKQFDHVCDVLTNRYRWLEAGNLLPKITPVTLLEALPSLIERKTQKSSFILVLDLAISLMKLQHLLRIRRASCSNDDIQLAHELRSRRHELWEPEDPIEWLLLQIDFNFLIRDDQYQVAQAMIAPGNTTNFVLQMNMGQGKSSVVIPMVVVQLANRQNLARVVVPRPLLLQTAQTLQGRLGGLIGRAVRHVPFSRKSSTRKDDLQLYEALHHNTLKTRGVILTLPEHMLSFQLSGLQELSYGHNQQAAFMVKLQEWFRITCKDLLDECDHMLAVKTQLIYPSGSQSMVDGHPYRWTVVQGILRLVKVHLSHLKEEFPESIEVVERAPGAFPTIYLLDFVVKEALIQRLTESILDGEVEMNLADESSRETADLITSFLRDATFPKTIAKKVAVVLRDKKNERNRLLLFRGLLVHRLLLMGLSKRWNVQYGIHPGRDPIAVPFRSKGVPSDQAEFGHPDVSILLTCLSFYYSGLSFSQFHQTISHLLKFDEPAQEFDMWIRTIYVPESLRSWRSINVDDEPQTIKLWNLLRYQVTVIDFFLNHFVFPRFAKTFLRKLVSSGWDVPITVDSYSTGGAIGRHNKSQTVGFSGTNDNRTLLPLNVLQNDLPGLSHTNAEVLTYLLQARNRRYYVVADDRGKRLSEKAFLEDLKRKSIRMLIDAGALILELDNYSLAKTWLAVDTEAQAAVYFDQNDCARVLYRFGKIQPLVASPFLNNLGACLVYLDEVS